ncbi:formylmethanofuran dehydrogenase subunit A [Methanobrevibacter millerae]|uniref:Formylmethanofuran dehydrogenase, subunit A n=1 Tax=Methanobrevibacter millerae TaxID=230361 RepID=A0A1G5W6T9_9EURY|nr:formylmethanofuran dehydrogenase subunit A [Methanobrevibacter millerae]SDA53849.1 formylmethanofuran dehydrogenase, subunit A [Methanobrevibacter millerae]
MMEYILKNGIVYDPINEINGEKKDVMFKDGIIVDEVSADAKVIDVTDKIVMPAGVDPHAHVAGPKLVVGRLYRPEDSRMGVSQKTKVLRSESGFSIPSCPATGYRYSRMGYGTVVEAAMPPLEAKHTHEEIATIPNIDIPALPLFGNNWFVMEYARDNNIEDLAAFIASWLKISKGYGVKIVNPCGSEAWGWGMNVHGYDDKAPYFDVTSREVVRALAKANEMLGLPHSIHIHPNDLGHPGNVPTTLATLDSVKDIKKSSKADIRNQVMHVTHLQFHSYTGNSWKDAGSGAVEVADYINKHDHITCDIGQVTFDETTTMTADAPMEYDLFKLSGLKWTNKDIECETAAGIIPCIYSKKSPVSTLQWGIGLELFLLINDPWKLCLTTDHPNAGPFMRYPRIISWLMSNEKRQDMCENEVHKWIYKRTTLPSIEREYDFYEIATITRAAAAKIYGFEDRGSLTPGCRADIAVYDINPNDIDPSRQALEIEKGFTVADYTIKDGQILVKDKEIVQVKESQNIWVNVKGWEKQEQKVLDNLMPFFNQYYSVKWENYPVHDHYVSNPIRVDVEK